MSRTPAMSQTNLLLLRNIFCVRSQTASRSRLWNQYAILRMRSRD